MVRCQPGLILSDLKSDSLIATYTGVVTDISWKDGFQITIASACARLYFLSHSISCFQYVSVSCITGVAIDGNNNEDKERFIKLVKKRGKVKALEEELYSRCL